VSRIIAVYGSSTVAPDSPEALLAYRVGRLLAERGAVVMNGGYGGVMEAVSRGAREADGKVVGVTVDSFQGRTPNPYLSVDQPTPDLIERLRVLTEEPDGFLVLPGSIGTAAELFLLWNLLWMKLRRPAPVVVLGNSLERVLGPGSDGLGIPREALSMITFARTPEEAVPLALGEAR
jgi:uncharacterized protein (TIGR00725 family)